MVTLALTIIGPDRPGIVAELSDIVANHGGNWLESHMANLAGQFAGIVQVQVTAESREAMGSALMDFEQNGFRITIVDSAAGAMEGGEAVKHPLELELLGRDHAGIVLDVTRAMANLGVSVQSLVTEVFSGSMSGGDMFKAKMRVGVPEGVDFDQLEQSLHAVSNDLMVDLLIEEPRR